MYAHAGGMAKDVSSKGMCRPLQGGPTSAQVVVQKYEDSLAVLPLIEAQVVSAAYRGPEASVIPQLRPLLRQRIESRAAEVSAYLVSVLVSAMMRPC